MKALVVAISVLLFLVSFSAGMMTAEVANANFYIPPYNTKITITSPQNIVYRTTTVDLNFFLETNGFGWYWYGIDDEELVEINVTTLSKEHLPGGNDTAYRYIRQASTFLNNLTPGKHTVRVVELSSEKRVTTFAMEAFKIDPYYTLDFAPPEISLSQMKDKTFNTRTVPLIFTVDEPTVQLEYSLDNMGNRAILGNTTLENLDEGSHSLQVYAHDTSYNIGESEIVHFAVDITAPKITILYLENKTYQFSQVPFSYLVYDLVSEAPSKISYSLDNQANTAIIGKTTLAHLADGSHSLVIYANDTAGNVGKSETIFFNVDTSTPSPSPSPTLQTMEPSPTIDKIQAEDFAPILIIIGFVIAMVVAGLLVFLAKQTRRK